jgi:hypothetical protein
LVERFVRIEEVRSSNLLSSTVCKGLASQGTRNKHFPNTLGPGMSLSVSAVKQIMGLELIVRAGRAAH